MRKMGLTIFVFLLTSCAVAQEQHTASSPECNYGHFNNRVKDGFKEISDSKSGNNQNYRYREYNATKSQYGYSEEEVYDEKYTLYNKPNDYTGYLKIGTPYKVLGKKYYPKCEANYNKKGVASWYGEQFYGKKTANGEIYDMHDMTAAHPTLPLPSIVRVTNLKNGKTVKVRVNDRGPFVGNRIIDVSKEAAKKLGFMSRGTTNVKVEFLPEETEVMLKNFGLR